MARLLIYEPSYRRVKAALSRFGEAVEPLVVDREGQITLAGEAVSAEDAQPEIAWFSGDLYQQKAAGPFVQAMLASETLKWFHSAAAGFDHPMFQRVAAKGVRFTTSHGQAVGMADYVVAGVLDVFQRGPERRAAQARKDWKGFNFREVLDTTWLIIGFGAIGQGVGSQGQGFGARVIGVRRNQAADPAADLIIHLAGCNRALAGGGRCGAVRAAQRRDATLGGRSFLRRDESRARCWSMSAGARSSTRRRCWRRSTRGFRRTPCWMFSRPNPCRQDSPFWAHPARQPDGAPFRRHRPAGRSQPRPLPGQSCPLSGRAAATP